MRLALLLCCLLGCSSKSDGSSGTLTCKASSESGAVAVTVAVPAGGLARTRERADSLHLAECTFEATDPKAPRKVEAPPVDDDDLSGRDVPAGPPQNVPPTLLEANRIAGNKLILPEDSTKEAIKLAGKDKVIGSYKLCLTVDGTVLSVTELKSTGFVDYDAKIKAEMQTWRYVPYVVNGKAVPVCTAMTFIYSAP